MLRYFSKNSVDQVNKLARMDGYANWRRTFIKRGKGGGCTIRMDLVILSNILHFGTKLGSDVGFNDVNQIFRGRDRYHKDITHARDRRPANAEAIHAIASELFKQSPAGVQASPAATSGWQSLFQMFTGCRTSELLRLRRDAATDKAAGFIRWLPAAEQLEREDGVLGFLYLQRSKKGINPYADIGAEFAEMLTAFFKWHEAAFGGAQAYYFPAPPFRRRESYGARLAAAAARLGLPHVTPHGYRSYFATKLRRDGKRSEEIAALMGDKTVRLVDDVYADHVKGEKLHWRQGAAAVDGKPDGASVPGITPPVQQAWEHDFNGV